MKNNKIGQKRFPKYYGGEYAAISERMMFFLCVTCLILLSVWAFKLYNTTVIVLLIIWGTIFLLEVLSFLSHRIQRFSLCADKVTIKKWFKKEEIALPYELTIIISYVEYPSSISLTNPYGTTTNQSSVDIIPGKYAISLLEKTATEEIMKQIHRCCLPLSQKLIRRVFPDQYIFSFNGDRMLLNQLLLEHSCNVIIPEYLQVFTNIEEKDIHVYNLEYLYKPGAHLKNK